MWWKVTLQGVSSVRTGPRRAKTHRLSPAALYRPKRGPRKGGKGGKRRSGSVDFSRQATSPDRLARPGPDRGRAQKRGPGRPCVDSLGHGRPAYTPGFSRGAAAMDARSSTQRGVRLLAGTLILLLLGACDGHSSDPVARATASPPVFLRIVQPRPGASIPLWEEARQLGKLKVLFDTGSTRLATRHLEGYRLLTRIDEGPPTQVRDVHTALIRKPEVGAHVLEAWYVDAAGERLRASEATAQVAFEVLP